MDVSKFVRLPAMKNDVINFKFFTLIKGFLVYFLVKFQWFIFFPKGVRVNVSMVSEQPSQLGLSTFQVKNILHILCFLLLLVFFSSLFSRDSFFISRDIEKKVLYVIDHLKLWYQMTLCLITLRTYKVIALVCEKLVIPTPHKPLEV